MWQYGGREREGCFFRSDQRVPFVYNIYTASYFQLPSKSRCDETQNLNKTESDTLFPETETPHSVPDPVCLLLSDPCFLGRCRQWRRSSPLRTGLLVLTAFNSATTDTSYNPLPLRYRLHISNRPWENVKSCHLIWSLSFWLRTLLLCLKKLETFINNIPKVPNEIGLLFEKIHPQSVLLWAIYMCNCLQGPLRV